VESAQKKEAYAYRRNQTKLAVVWQGHEGHHGTLLLLVIKFEQPGADRRRLLAESPDLFIFHSWCGFAGG
jgi:hypothetical protein